MSNESSQSAPTDCPVDHKARANWLNFANSKPSPPPEKSEAPQAAPEACPVDHKARSSWLSFGWSKPSPPPGKSEAPQAAPETCPVDHKAREAWLQKNNSPSAPSPDASPILSQAPPAVAHLDSTREISSIPRAQTSPAQPAGAPSNHENESGMDKSGMWIYPSERMFFDAMKRKQHDPRAEDMRAIVPIHNAVNERAWKEIRAWEKGWGADSCGGPKLVSFSGMASKLTPRARFNKFLGYQPPFDRHDWVIDRCGTQVEYVIDFYQGKNEGREGKPLNFYIDVRPKLNSVEGWKMRMARTIGL